MADIRKSVGDIGITKALGNSEVEIMDILWRWGEATVRQVYEEVRKGRNVSLPAVMLSMQRLAKRGLVQKLSGQYGAIYRPQVTRDGVSYILVTEVIDKVLQGSPGPVVSRLVERLSRKELDELVALIKDIRKS